LSNVDEFAKMLSDKITALQKEIDENGKQALGIGSNQINVDCMCGHVPLTKVGFFF
jgi:hypothetical protein